jgi:hypothetical protein
MAREKRRGIEMVPTWSSKIGRENPAPPELAPIKPADLPFVCKDIRPGVPEDAKQKAWLKANLEKMGCGGLMGIQWGHNEKHWLKEVCSQDTSAFSNSVRANPNLWKEGLIAEIFDMSKEEKGMPQIVPIMNNALKYFGIKVHKNEGCKFLDCQDNELQKVLKYLVPLITPMKPARVIGKMANSVVESLYLGKKVS